MKKFVYLIAFCAACLNVPIFSQPDTNNVKEIVQEKDAPDGVFSRISYAQVCLGYCAGNELALHGFSARADFSVDDRGGGFETGMRIAHKIFDFGARVLVWPVKFSNIRFGVGVSYGLNYRNYDDMVNSFAPGLHFEIKAPGIFSMRGNFCYVGIFDSSAVLEAPEIIHSYGASLTFAFEFPGNFGFDIKAETYELLKHAAFGLPWVTFDFHYIIKNRCQIGVSATVKYMEKPNSFSGKHDLDFNVRARYIF